ncbi:MFS transporter [Chloroflexota bacterium]
MFRLTLLRRRISRLMRHPLMMTLYVPGLLFSISMGMMGPILPLYAADFEISYALVGLVLAAGALGGLIGDLPAGIVLRRMGRKRAMVLGLVISAVATTALFWTQSIGVVIALRLLTGLGHALYGVARHTYIADSIDITQRGRATAILAGMGRLGRFIGPATAGFVAVTFGLRAPFLLYGVAALLAAGFVLVAMPRREATTEAAQEHAQAAGPTLWTMLQEQYHILLTAGTGQILAQATRSGWITIIPLYGRDMLGLDVDQIGLVMSIMALVDTAMFYPTGIIMDRWGRKFAIVPSFALQGLGLALVPLAGAFTGLVGAAVVIGFGNGLGAGTMMTLGADLAPEDARGEFLGTWRLIGDTGGTVGPLMIGNVADALALPAAALVAAGMGLAAATVFALFVPETLKKKRRKRKIASKSAA